jgi:hypothetical protein
VKWTVSSLSNRLSLLLLIWPPLPSRRKDTATQLSLWLRVCSLYFETLPWQLNSTVHMKINISHFIDKCEEPGCWQRFITQIPAILYSRYMENRRGPPPLEILSLSSERGRCRTSQLQDYRVQEYRLHLNVNILRESLSVDSQNIPCATLQKNRLWVICFLVTQFSQ